MGWVATGAFTLPANTRPEPTRVRPRTRPSGTDTEAPREVPFS